MQQRRMVAARYREFQWVLLVKRKKAAIEDEDTECSLAPHRTGWVMVLWLDSTIYIYIYLQEVKKIR